MGKSTKDQPLVIFFIGVLLILSFFQIFSNDFRIKILNIFRAPLKVISGSFYILRDVSHFKELRRDNKILRENVGNLERKILDLEEMYLENKRLRELLGFRESEARHRFLPAMVIARDLLGLKDTIIIDKGKRDGIEKDMVVISGNGLCGRVRECGWSISRVLFITDPNSVVSGIVQRTRDEGAVVGNMRSGLLLKYLELTSDVKEGDKVISSGFGGIFEKGILIGDVVSIKKDESGLYLNATVKPALDMMKLEEVLVIKE